MQGRLSSAQLPQRTICSTGPKISSLTWSIALTVPGFYRTSGGAEIDLLLELPGGKRWAIEVKRSRAAKPARGFCEACEDLQPARRFVFHGGLDRYPGSADVEAIWLRELAETLSQLR